jgi:uncharacterized membrane protein
MIGIKKKERVWEIDFVRGLLILLLLFMHLMFDLQYYYGINVNYEGGILNVIGFIFAPVFIMISGISTSFSRSSFKRGLIVLSIALGITVVTYLFNPAFVIVFGILHFMGVCMIASPLFKKLPTPWLFVLSALIASTAFMLPYIKVTNNYLFMFGLYTSEFRSSDYYPLFPYAWAFLFGMGLSRVLYKEKKSAFPFTIKSKFVNFLGRNSLYVYIIHQPIILAVLGIIMRTPK